MVIAPNPTPPRPTPSVDEASIRPMESPGDKRILTMMRLIDLYGCQLRPSDSASGKLRGLCPFHRARNLAESYTLNVHPQDGTFNCDHCHHRGDAITFISTLWRVAAPEVDGLIQETPLEQIGITRPLPDLAKRRQLPHYRRPQNTGLLTLAMEVYRDNLFHEYIPLRFLSALDITPEAAVTAQIGFSTGLHLAQKLATHGASAEEINDTPLLKQQSELLADRIVIADTDMNGGVIWLAGLTPTVPKDHKQGWSPRRPKFMGPTGMRPYLLGSNSIPRNSHRVVLTDDLRFYIVAKAAGIPVAAILQDGDTAATVDHLMTRHPRSVALAMHNRQDRWAIRDLLSDRHPEVAVYEHPRRALMQLIDYQTRDLDTLWQRQAAPEDPPVGLDEARRDPLDNPTPSANSTDDNADTGPETGEDSCQHTSTSPAISAKPPSCATTEMEAPTPSSE